MNIVKKALELAAGAAELVKSNAVTVNNFQVGYIKYNQHHTTHQMMVVPDKESVKLTKLAGGSAETAELLFGDEKSWEAQLRNFIGHSCRIAELETTFVSKEKPQLSNGSLFEVNFEDLAW